MRFSMLLLALSIMLKNAAKRNEAFKKYISNARARILIKTEDGSCARLFDFNKGVVTSRGGDTKDFDVALVWKDPSTGFAVMNDKSKSASFEAAAQGKLRVEGMSVYAQWFEDGMKLII
jgi:hypothetical protein